MGTTEFARNAAKKAIWSYLSEIAPKSLGDAEIDAMTEAAMKAVEATANGFVATNTKRLDDPRQHGPI